MKRTYNLTSKLVAYTLLLSLFLQSCNHSSNFPVLVGQEEIKENKQDTLTEFPSPELTAYKRLGFNRFLPVVHEQDIELGKKLGGGGFGTVYQANYKGSVVALKVLKSNFSDESVAAFQKEAVIMANQCHDNIVNFLGFCPTKVALIMEYMPGGSLWNLLKGTNEIGWPLRYQIALGRYKK